MLILVEWTSWARVVRLGPEHLPEELRSLSGDSIGCGDDTLVVETNFLFEPGVPREGLHVVEHFPPLDANRLLYRFAVHDPDYVTPLPASARGQRPMPASTNAPAT